MRFASPPLRPSFLRDRAEPETVRPLPLGRPVVSVLVPLFRERAIAEQLVRRLERISYPRERLDILLVVESDDRVTRATLAEITLPHWMRTVVVPAGTLRTKPRALNYALDFCRGSIVGIYDAEDAPAPDQIARVADRFAEAPREVACLQGILDFYNASENWLARCFTIEYATWFRIVLPGLQRLGLVLPLGGTTLFLRREVLEEVGGWDAHNVTEDAELGLRLARRGYRTELIASVTEEEANARLWPWIRQRSRWLKGYAKTWGVHMRAPRAMLRELGFWRTAGVQILFFGTLMQFLSAPLFWSFWLLLAGLPHPLAESMSMTAFAGLWASFMLLEVLNLAISGAALKLAGKRRMLGWVVTLPLYFPLATVALLKGLAELCHRPFYWDKTEHGRSKAIGG
jgi:cellulose synthase/poly-beta-1,6-N-acetylglucosamine synthase-like glycosyltransferase